MSTLEVNSIKPISGSSTVTLGESGDTIALASGASQTLAVNTPAFHATMNATQSIAHATATKLNFDTEVFDTDSDYDTTNKRFLPTVAGKFFFHASMLFNKASSVGGVQILFRKNGSDAVRTLQGHFYGNDNQNYMVSGIISCNGSSDYVECFAQQDSGGSCNINNDSPFTFFQGYKIIGA